MLLLVVWVVVGVLAAVVLGSLAYATVGALQRLGREAAALDREVRPLLDQLQDASARRGESAARPAPIPRSPGWRGPARRTPA